MEGTIVLFTMMDGTQLAFGPFIDFMAARAWEDKYADAPYGSSAAFVSCHVAGDTPTRITDWIGTA